MTSPGLLARGWELPVAAHLGPEFAYQQGPCTCGPASLANVLRSLGQEIDERSVLADARRDVPRVSVSGMTLDQLAGLTARHGRRTMALRDLTYEQFQAHLRLSNDPGHRYIVNFHRGPIFGQGGGHHSPLGGYLPDQDLVFVLDVNERYRPWLVEARRLFEAVGGVDPGSQRRRGLLLVS